MGDTSVRTEARVRTPAPPSSRASVEKHRSLRSFPLTSPFSLFAGLDAHARGWESPHPPLLPPDPLLSIYASGARAA